LRSTDEDDSVSLVGYCYCGQGEDYDDMICCDNKDCVIGWEILLSQLPQEYQEIKIKEGIKTSLII